MIHSVYQFVNPYTYNILSTSGYDYTLSKLSIFAGNRPLMSASPTRVISSELSYREPKSAYVHEHSAAFNNITWSPDGDSIAIVCSDNIVRISNIRYSDTSSSYDLPGEWEDLRADLVSWSPDGRYIAVGYNEHYLAVDEYWGIIRIFDVESNTIIHRMSSGWTESLCWSPDSRRIAYGSYSGSGGDIYQRKTSIYDMETELSQSWGNDKYTPIVSWGKDSHKIAATEGRIINIIDVNSGKIIHSIDTNYYLTEESEDLIDHMICNPILPFVATTSKSCIEIRNIESGKLLHTLSHFSHESEVIKSITWNADGTMLSSASDRELRIWDTFSGELIWKIIREPGVYNNMSWSPVSNKLAVVASDQKVRIWSFKTVHTRIIHKEALMTMLKIGNRVFNTSRVNLFIIEPYSVNVLFDDSEIEIYGEDKVEIIGAWLQENSLSLEEWYKEKFIDLSPRKPKKDYTRNSQPPQTEDDEDLPF